MSDEKPMSIEEMKELRKHGNVAITTMLMMRVIPQTETELINDLKHLVNNHFAYCDPLALSFKLQWIKLKDVVNRHIKDTDVEWRKLFIDIYMNTL